MILPSLVTLITTLNLVTSLSIVALEESASLKPTFKFNSKSLPSLGDLTKPSSSMIGLNISSISS